MICDLRVDIDFCDRLKNQCEEYLCPQCVRITCAIDIDFECSVFVCLCSFKHACLGHAFSDGFFVFICEHGEDVL